MPFFPEILQFHNFNDKKKFFNEFGLDLNKKLVSIFPGSRNFEVNNLLTIFIEASKIIQQEIPDIQFAICQSCAINDNLIKPFVPENIKIIKGKNYELLALSDALILASGTVALEAALYSTPMIISYKGPALFYFIYLMVRCIDKVSLPNIILNKNVIPELIQNKAKPEIIAKHIILLLKDKNKYEEIKNELKNVKHFLTEKKSYLETAKIILSEIQ